MRAFEAPRLAGRHPGVGATVEAVESIGKHLEIRWSDGLVVRTHMRMSGSWHLYRPGDRWRLPRRDARVIVTTDEWTAVCFRAPDVESYEARTGVVPGALARLGPDLCRADADLAECTRRLVGYPAPDRAISEVLLDQRVACGVGNVFKSEVLFACRVHPFEPVATIDARRAAELIEMAARLLRDNLDGGRRTTITSPGAPGGLAVYGRAGRPCPVCGAAICVQRRGEHARSTYWCPTCQPASDRVAGTSPPAGSAP
jgi:endonuclease-8